MPGWYFLCIETLAPKLVSQTGNDDRNGRGDYLVFQKYFSGENVKDAFLLHYSTGSIHKFRKGFKLTMPFFDQCQQHCPIVSRSAILRSS